MSDRILITNLQLPVLIGVYDFERLAPQRVIFELALDADCALAGQSDNVHDTVDYGKVVEVVTQICDDSSYALLEALAEAVCQTLFAQFNLISAIELTLHKPDIMPNDVQVAINIKRQRIA